MSTNIGAMDRGFRVVIGLLLLSLLFLWEGWARWLGLIGLVPIATVIAGWCPLYALFGIDTRGSTPPQKGAPSV